MPTYQSKDFYASLFHLLLNRDLTDKEYLGRFSTLDIRAYISSILDSHEFVEKIIYPAFDRPITPIIDYTKIANSSDENCLHGSNLLAVGLSINDLHAWDSCGSTLRCQFILIISETQIIHPGNKESAVKGIDTRLLQQALHACRGAVEICTARSALVSALLRPPRLFTGELEKNATLSLELFLLPVSHKFRRYSLYSSLFTSLLGRSLSRDEYDLDFSTLSSLEFTILLMRSPEFLVKSIFETLPSCTCARITTPLQLITQFPGALDDGVYIVVSTYSKNSLKIVVRLNPVSEIVEIATEPVALNPTDPGSHSDAIIAALIQYNSFTNEDLLSVVSNFAVSTEVDVEILASLQCSYQLPELTGIFSSASSCTVSLVPAGQLSGFVSQLDSGSAPSNLILAI